MKINQNYIARVGLAISLALATVLLPAAPAVADSQGISITTSPVSLVLKSKPGTTATTVLHVQNNAPAPVLMQIKMFTFTASGTSGKPALELATPADTFLNWATFTPATFVAQPDVPVAVTMSINIPSTAALGYNYGVAFDPITSHGSGTAISGSNVILVLLDTSSGNEVHSVRIDSLTSVHHIYEYLPATFNVNLHNNGNVFLAPGGDIFISKNPNFVPGSIITTLPINSAVGNILPNSNRVFAVNWSSGFPVYQLKKVGGSQVMKNGKPLYQLSWNFSQANDFRFGKYYAKAIVSYTNDERQIPVTAVVSFWVIPWKLLSVSLIILLLIAGLIISDAVLFHRLRKMRHGSVKNIVKSNKKSEHLN